MPIELSTDGADENRSAGTSRANETKQSQLIGPRHRAQGVRCVAASSGATTYVALFFEVENHLLGGLLRRHVSGVDHHFRIFRLLVGIGYAGE